MSSHTDRTSFDLETVNRRAFYESDWLSGGLTAHELSEHLMNLPIDYHPITCLIQSSGTGKSRLLYETSLCTPTLYASLISSRYGSFPPPAKFASTILSLRNTQQTLRLLVEWTDRIRISALHPDEWFDYQLTSIPADAFQSKGGEQHKLTGDTPANAPSTTTAELTTAQLIERLEENVLAMTAGGRLFLCLDEAQCLLDEAEMRLVLLLRESLIQFNRAAKDCSIVCLLTASSLPSTYSMTLSRHLRMSASIGLHSDQEITQLIEPIFALGAQGETEIPHPSSDVAAFVSTTASLRRFGRPAWRVGLNDDSITALYSQRLALMRTNKAMYHRALIGLTAHLTYRDRPDITEELMRHGWAQLVSIDSRLGHGGIAYPSEPFLASVAQSQLRHNTEIAGIFDTLAADARKGLWDIEQRHSLLGRLSILRGLSYCRGGHRPQLTSLARLTRKLWGGGPATTSFETQLPATVRDYCVNMNHFIRPDLTHLSKVSLSTFFQRCAGWIVSSQYNHFDFAIPLWTGKAEEALEESRMTAAFVSVTNSVRDQRPWAQFLSFFQSLHNTSPTSRRSKSPVLELARRVAKPAVFIVMDNACKTPSILNTGAALPPTGAVVHKSKRRESSSSASNWLMPENNLRLQRRASPGGLSDAETRCTSVARTSIDAGRCEIECSDHEEMCSMLSSQPSTADWIVIHAPSYPGLYRSPLWLRAAALSMDPSISNQVIPFTNPRASSLFYHQAMSTTPTSLLVDN